MNTLIQQCDAIAKWTEDVLHSASRNSTCMTCHKEPPGAVKYMSAQFCYTLSRDKEEEDRYDEPLVWIGLYIVAASLFCILAMAVDLFHGLRNKKFWFPCKYFTLNAASITVITVAMKLPVDLNNPMPGIIDQYAKAGSLYFLCIMMATFMPSLASMDNKQLVANVIGLVILVVTVIVNTYIQIRTGLINDEYGYYLVIAFYIIMVMLLLLLIISISSAITIPASKQILEFKYQAINEKFLNDQQGVETRMLSFETLIQHVRRYWVMTETGNPQFAMVINPLCSAVGVICLFGLVIYITMVFSVFYTILGGYKISDVNQSDYKWSMTPIYWTQLFGVMVGVIMPTFRCFAVLTSKLSIKWSRNHMKVFIVEQYWTQKLFEWKKCDIAFPLGSRRSRTLVYNLKNLVLNIFIAFQEVTVVSCKIIGLIPIVIVIVVIYSSHLLGILKTLLFAIPMSSTQPTSILEVEQDDTNEDIGNYVLQLQDETELAKRTLKRISNSMNRLIKKAEKKQHNNLLRLLEKSTGFQGVANFDSDLVKPLSPLCKELVNCWSLPVVTLTCIAIALPYIEKNEVDWFLSSVTEGILYTHLLEESLNTSGKFVDIQRASKILWHEVEYKGKWLGNTLQRNKFEGKTSPQILEWFADQAKEIVDQFDDNTIREPMENSHDKLIAANSMYRITQIIMLNNERVLEQDNKEELFKLISGTIADILAACLTNIPRVIITKCQESRIEKRGASVEAAIKLLGRTSKIINLLQSREIPSMDPDQMASIDEWRACLKQPLP